MFQLSARESAMRCSGGPAVNIHVLRTGATFCDRDVKSLNPENSDKRRSASARGRTTAARDLIREV
jgi:hypothetical protein